YRVHRRRSKAGARLVQGWSKAGPRLVQGQCRSLSAVARGLTAFSVEFAHLQLDGAWVDAVAASLGQDEAEHVFAHALELGWYRAWGGDGAPAPLVADETHGHDEAKIGRAHV